MKLIIINFSVLSLSYLERVEAAKKDIETKLQTNALSGIIYKSVIIHENVRPERW